MNYSPYKMEDYFTPGFKTKPAVHVGSQTFQFFSGNPEEQAWEGFHLAGAGGEDLTIVRNFDDDYLTYWQNLMQGTKILNLRDTDLGKFLVQVLLESPKAIRDIKERMAENAKLMVFIPTVLEKQLAKKIGIPLHGSPMISDTYGTKSGIRTLAKEAKIPMTPGFICKTLKEVVDAIEVLRDKFPSIAVKHDISLSGYFSRRLEISKIDDLKSTLSDIIGHPFIDGKDILVVEGWLKGKKSLCAHIEIPEGKEPVICGGWEQLIDKDGVSYMGAGPLRISQKTMKSFLTESHKLAQALKKKGAVGSYGPDFLVIDDGETNMEPDTCALLELNARVPFTAFPLETIKQVKGTIGNGFCSKHIKLPTTLTFNQIKEALEKENLLITTKDSKAKGVVPYNAGLLPWKLFDVVAMGDTWEEASQIMNKVDKIFLKKSLEK